MTVTRKRVVITGMGHLSSIATNVPEFKQALFDKTCGIKPSKKYLEWFEDANASEVLQPLNWPGLSDEMVASLDNAALWAYKVGHEALEHHLERFKYWSRPDVNGYTYKYFNDFSR